MFLVPGHVPYGQISYFHLPLPRPSISLGGWEWGEGHGDGEHWLLDEFKLEVLVRGAKEDRERRFTEALSRHQSRMLKVTSGWPEPEAGSPASVLQQAQPSQPGLPPTHP